MGGDAVPGGLGELGWESVLGIEVVGAGGADSGDE